MDLALSAEDRDLVAAFDALLSKESPPDRVRAAEPLGFDPALWTALTGFGVPSLALGPDAAGIEQLALLAETAGRHLASAPVVEGLVTARLLARAGATALADACADGRIASLVLRPGARADLVPAGAVASLLVSYDGRALTVHEDEPPMAATPNVGGLAVADRDLPDGRAIAHGEEAREAFDHAVREWRLLTAAQLVGLAGRALEITVAYVKDRRVFDRPVGSFQTVAARLADHATALDGSRLLVREAAWACATGRPRAAALTTMAFCHAAEQAVALAGDGLHFHGGYGFTLDYDIQLYYRRAQAHPLVWGSVQREYQRLADELFGAARSGARP